MTIFDKEELRCLIHPSWSNLQDYIDLLNDILDRCEDQEEREWLSTAVDGFNIVITNVQKVLDKEKNK